MDRLRTGLLLLATEEGKQGNVGNLDNFETNTGDITNSVTTATEAGDEDLVVLIDEGKATITRDEGGDLLAVLDQLHTRALTDSRVRLLGLNTAE